MLTIPIFSGGRNRANLSLAETRRDMAVISYEKAIQEAFKEVREGLEVRALLSDRLSAQSRYLSAQRRVLEVASSRYQSGAISYLEVLEAQRDVFEAEMELLSIRRDELFNALSLYVAMGGGFGRPPSTLDADFSRAEAAEAETTAAAQGRLPSGAPAAPEEREAKE